MAAAPLVPMPNSNSRVAPFFKGRRVSDFLDSLELAGDAAGLARSALPPLVLRYCSTKVRQVLKNAPALNATDWTAVRTLLIDLYASEDTEDKISADKLRTWVRKHSEEGNITRLTEVDRYYRRFLGMAQPLKEASLLLENDMNLLFYRGIPKALRQRIKRHLPADKLKVSSTPGMAETLKQLQKEFDAEDIDADPDDIALDDSDKSDANSDDSDDDIDDAPLRRSKPKKKKSVSFKNKDVPAAPIVEPIAPSSIETLTRQMEELRLHTANLQREFFTSRNTALNSGSGPSQGLSQGKRCFICDGIDIHRLGIPNCLEVPKLVQEGLASFNQLGRFTLLDGSELPKGIYSGGGVAKVLRDARAASQSLKGKMWPGRDQPPHMSNSIGLELGGQRLLEGDVYAVAATNDYLDWKSASPVTRSQNKDNRVDPLKRPEAKKAAKPLAPEPPTANPPLQLKTQAPKTVQGTPLANQEPANRPATRANPNPASRAPVSQLPPPPVQGNYRP